MHPAEVQLRLDLERPFVAGYRIAILLVTAYLVILIPYYLTSSTILNPRACAVVAGSGVLLLLSLVGLLGQEERALPHAQLFGGLALAVIGLVMLTQMVLRQDLRLTAHMMLLLMGSGFVFRRARLYMVVQAGIILGWAATVAWASLPGDPVFWTIALVASLFVSLGEFTILRLLLRSQLELRLRDLQRQAEMEALNQELGASLERVRTLRGLLPICAQCKQVRDDQGYWQRVETYVEANTHAEFTHGLCPACADQLKAEFERMVEEERDSEGGER